jgi:hypothetical protein
MGDLALFELPTYYIVKCIEQVKFDFNTCKGLVEIVMEAISNTVEHRRVKWFGHSYCYWFP